jgi:hypothetical protein
VPSDAQALALDPTVHYNRTGTLANLDRYEMLAVLDQALELQPEYPAAE